MLVLALVAALVALVVYHRRRGAHLLAAACILAVAAVVGSVLSVSQLTVGRVGFSSHHVRFLWPLAIFVHLALGWSLVDRLLRGVRQRQPHPRVNRTVPWVLGAATVLLSVAAVPYFAQPQGPVAFYSSMPILRRVMPELEKLARRTAGALRRVAGAHLRAIQLDGDDAPAGAGHRVPGDR